MKKIATILLLLLGISSFGQTELPKNKDERKLDKLEKEKKKKEEKKLKKSQQKAKRDSIRLHTDLGIAAKQMKSIHEGGAIVVRLLLHKKNAELYRKAGDHKVADRLEKKLREENRAIVIAFKDEYFRFCPVYFIESKNYGRVLNGEKYGYFLNNNLQIDSSIKMEEENFIFLESSDVYEVVVNPLNLLEYQKTSTPIAYNALVYKDKDLNQLFSPFPYYISKTSFTINANMWDDMIEGEKFISKFLLRDSVRIGDSTSTLKIMSNADLKNYSNYFSHSKESKEFILKNLAIFLSKNSFQEYIDEKYRLNKLQKSIIFKVWEHQIMMYGFYSKTKDLKNLSRFSFSLFDFKE